MQGAWGRGWITVPYLTLLIDHCAGMGGKVEDQGQGAELGSRVWSSLRQGIGSKW